MANPEHLKILKQGVEVWNAWREESPEVRPNLSEEDLRTVKFAPGIYEGASMGWDAVNLVEADLLRANLGGAMLSGANLRDANLQGTGLQGANLFNAILTGAHLEEANLFCTVLVGSQLKDACLDRAHLAGTYIGSSNIESLSLRGTIVQSVVFSNLDLSQAQGLEEIEHHGPSTIGIDTFQRSGDSLPDAFLRGCGLSDWEIEVAKLYRPHLSQEQRTTLLYQIDCLQGGQPIQFNPLFVSYSHADKAFVEQLEPQFDERGIRYWRDVRDLKAGRMETQIDRAIRLNPTVLLVLSERSVESDWVEWEVTKARKLEKELRRDVLCPVALDDAWKTCPWEGPLRRQVEKYHILDFSEWRDIEAFSRQFQKLIDGLGLFYPRANGE